MRSPPELPDEENNGAAMRILVADDHPLFRFALRQILAAEFRGAEIIEVATAEEALEQVGKQDWALLVLDISMTGRSGMDLLPDLKRARPKMPVLILTSHPEEQFAVRCLKAGASGYLTKHAAPEELGTAARRLLAGERYLTAGVAAALLDSLAHDSSRPAHELLSDREFEVLRLIANGRSLKAIAASFSVSIKSVSTYRMRLLRKLGLKTNADLVRYAINGGLVSKV